ncbi:MAG: multidrug efflux SMR transporter [Thalassolituus sp.]|jgi:quaternary ammonium compound-resistance protein SugE
MTKLIENKVSNGRAWLMLLLAGAFEIAYALSVASSEAFTVLNWSISAIVFFLLTLYALSVALKTIDVGIGYAVWAGIGAVGSSVFGGLLLDQVLTLEQAFWLAVIIFGVVWLKLSSNEQSEVEDATLALK